MVVGLAPVPSKNIMHMGTCIQVFKSSVAMTRIGIAIRGNGLAMSLIFCACITGFRYKRAGNAYKQEPCSSEKRRVDMGVVFALLAVVGVIVLVRSLRLRGLCLVCVVAVGRAGGNVAVPPILFRTLASVDVS